MPYSQTYTASTRGAGLQRLNDLPVFLSASLPDELHKTPRAQDLEHFIAAFLRGLFAAGGRLIFGGHPTVTPLVHRVAQDFGEKRIDLYQLSRFRNAAPPEIYEPEFDLHWINSDDLTPMREAMVNRARASVIVGGRTFGYSGNIPGIRDEYQRFLAHHPEGPTYILGLLDGEASNLIREMDRFSEPNGLDSRESDALHHTTNVDLAVTLILADLRRHADSRSS